MKSLQHLVGSDHGLFASGDPADSERRGRHPAAVGTVAIIGIPTDVIPNRLFGRQTPVHPYDLAVLIALGILTGALIATYSIAATAS